MDENIRFEKAGYGVLAIVRNNSHPNVHAIRDIGKGEWNQILNCWILSTDGAKEVINWFWDNNIFPSMDAHVLQEVISFRN
jgi:hypothetical protein